MRFRENLYLSSIRWTFDAFRALYIRELVWLQPRITCKAITFSLHCHPSLNRRNSVENNNNKKCKTHQNFYLLILVSGIHHIIYILAMIKSSPRENHHLSNGGWIFNIRRQNDLKIPKDLFWNVHFRLKRFQKWCTVVTPWCQLLTVRRQSRLKTFEHR